MFQNLFMDMNKDIRKQLIREVSAKSSFDRFGDVLMELIVSHLTIEDKFKFECLSKRIQNIIFSKQYVLKPL